MINQQPTRNKPVGTAADTRISVPRQTFENYTVVAFALVAESLADAPGSNPGAQPGVQVQVLPSAQTYSWGPRVRDGIMEDVPDSGSGARNWACRFDPCRTHHTSGRW